MTDLTEKWKKGELPAGWYWVEGSRAEGIYAYTAEYLNNMYRPKNDEKIIEQVPNYEIVNSLIKENQQLKELLNYIRDEIADMPVYAKQMGLGWISEAAYRIDNAIGEKEQD